MFRIEYAIEQFSDIFKMILGNSIHFTYPDSIKYGQKYQCDEYNSIHF